MVGFNPDLGGVHVPDYSFSGKILAPILLLRRSQSLDLPKWGQVLWTNEDSGQLMNSMPVTFTIALLIGPDTLLTKTKRL
jgi:hypothetical protein